MAENHITLYEGKSKATGKPFRALKLTVGEWSVLHFPKTNFEMDYIVKNLQVQTTPTPLAPGSDPIDLNADDVPVKTGMFS